jgi:hypothetical protein
MKQRSIPIPIMNVLRRHFPRLMHGVIEGDNVYLVMTNKVGQHHEAIHYRASPEFMTAVRVAESGVDNLKMLFGEAGFQMGLLVPPPQD